MNTTTAFSRLANYPYQWNYDLPASRVVPYLLVGSVVAVLDSQGSSVAQAAFSRTCLPKRMSHRRVLATDRRKHLSEKELDELLSSALPAADYRELRYLALTDDLTCLYNRRGFFAAAARQLARRTAQGRNYGVVNFHCSRPSRNWLR